MIGNELADVLLDALLAVGQVDFSSRGKPFGDSCQRLIGRSHREGLGVFTKQITVEGVADLGYGPAIDERFGPAIFPNDVVDESSYVPIGARRRRRPVARRALNGASPKLNAAAVRLIQRHALPHSLANTNFANTNLDNHDLPTTI